MLLACGSNKKLLINESFGISIQDNRVLVTHFLGATHEWSFKFCQLDRNVDSEKMAFIS